MKYVKEVLLVMLICLSILNGALSLYRAHLKNVCQMRACHRGAPLLLDDGTCVCMERVE